MGNQEQDKHKDTGSRWGQWEWGCEQGHRHWDKTGMRTSRSRTAVRVPGSRMGTGTQHRVGAHPSRRCLLKVPCPVGASQAPGDGDKWEQLGGSTQDHSLLMALLRVGAHPRGMTQS